MKNILFIVDHLKGGGAELMVLSLAKRLQEKNIEVNILSLNAINNYSSKDYNINIIDLGFPEYWVSGKLLIDKPIPTDSISKMNEVIKTIAPDCIIVTIWYSFMLIPYIVHRNVWAWSQADILPEFSKTNNPIKFFRNKYKAQIFENKFKEVFNASKIITVNDGLRLKYLSLLETKEVVTINNGLDLVQDIASKFSNKKWDVIFVGRLSPTKQINHAIEAFKASQIKGKMLIVGEGAQHVKLKKLVSKLGLDNQIFFKGWLSKDEVLTLIEQSKILVLPSRTEGYPLVIGEALMSGTPVVAYNCSEGISSQLYTNDMKRGLVKPNDIRSLSNALLDVINNPYVIPDNISIKYDLDVMTNKFLSVIS